MWTYCKYQNIILTNKPFLASIGVDTAEIWTSYICQSIHIPTRPPTHTPKVISTALRTAPRWQRTSCTKLGDRSHLRRCRARACTTLIWPANKDFPEYKHQNTRLSARCRETTNWVVVYKNKYVNILVVVVCSVAVYRSRLSAARSAKKESRLFWKRFSLFSEINQGARNTRHALPSFAYSTFYCISQNTWPNAAQEKNSPNPGHCNVSV